VAAADHEDSAVKLTRAGSVMGTPEFMAPEQALGRTLDGRADLYAVGCVGYWLLTGQLVFKKTTQMATLLAHIDEPPPQVDRHSATELPLGVRLCIMDCLAKSPEHRPQDARALLERLTAVELELPESERWTEARARAWWLQHRPKPRVSLSSDLATAPRPALRVLSAAEN
jgi:serine/threonine-protein kinase